MRSAVACGLLFFIFCQAHAVNMDGVIAKDEWRNALVYENFRVLEPRTFAAPPYRTVLRILPTPEALYVSLWIEYPREKRTRGMSARDTDPAADPVFLHIDFEGDGRTAYEFTSSLSGAQRDSAILNQSQFVNEWDAAWRSAVAEDDTAWSVEFELPWIIAPRGHSTATTRTIGIFAGRFQKDDATFYGFPAITSSSATYVQDFQKVALPRYQAAEVSAVDLFPYALTTRDLLGSATSMKAGVDLVWLPDGRSRIGATVNPDFAQVESDELVVNFSAIETFFTDRRPFFTERLELFDLRPSERDRLIHTRRIGAQTDAGTDPSTDVLGALKYTGSFGHTELGAFAAFEDDSTSSQGRTFAATRWRYNQEHAGIGILSTFVDRPAIEREAQVHAIDFDWRVDQATKLRGQLMGSLTKDGSAQTARSDAEGFGGWLELSYQTTGGSWQRLIARTYGTDLDFNDFGFQERTGFRSLTSRTELVEKTFPTRQLRSGVTELELAVQENTAGATLRETGLVRQRLNWHDGSVTTAQASITAAGIDDLFTRGNGDVRLPAWLGVRARHETPQSGRWRMAAELAGFEEGLDDGSSWEAAVQGTFHSSEYLAFSWRASYIAGSDWLLWLRGRELGTFNKRQLNLLAGMDWYPAQRHELRVRWQWIGLSATPAASYTLLDSGSLRPVNRLEADLPVSTLALQVRYRYELAPLSDFYLVYSRGGHDTSASAADDFGSQLSRSWDSVTAHQLVAKLTRRF